MLNKNSQKRESVSASNEVTPKNNNTNATIQFNEVSSKIVFADVVFGFAFVFFVLYFLGLATR